MVPEELAAEEWSVDELAIEEWPAEKLAAKQWPAQNRLAKVLLEDMALYQNWKKHFPERKGLNGREPSQQGVFQFQAKMA